MKKNTNTQRIYLGIWFQRTSLHLREFFEFLNGNEGVEGLDPEKTKKLRKLLHATDVRLYREKGFDMINATSEDVEMSMTEDGIILIHTEFNDIKSAAEILESFYSKKLGPVLNHIFSRGAPLPKDLSSIKEVYPLYFVGYNLKPKEIKAAFSVVNDISFSTIAKADIEITTGNELVIMNVTNESIFKKIEVDELVRNIVLFREFEKQLGQYLNLHRSIWEKVANIREAESLTIEQFPKIRAELLDYLKTLSFVKARLSQMQDILNAREATLGSEIKDTMRKLDLISRFEMFKADQTYLLHLWEMTIEYTEGTVTLLDSLLTENTQREIGILQIITFVGVLTGFFGMNIPFPWQPEWRLLFNASFIILAVIAFVSLGTRSLLKASIYKRKIKMR